MILAMCQQHPRQIQRQRHTQRQIQRQRQERTSKKKSSCICFAYKLHIIHRRKAEDIVYHSMTTTKTHTKTNTKTITKTNRKTKTKFINEYNLIEAGINRILSWDGKNGDLPSIRISEYSIGTPPCDHPWWSAKECLRTPEWCEKMCKNLQWGINLH